MSDAPSAKSHMPYQAGHFEPLFEVEDRHFWFRSRRRCIAAAARLIPEGSVHDIIEHGCGTGFILAELKRLFPEARVTGADLFAEGLAFARRRFAGPLIQADLFSCDFRAAFDLIGLFDVLEHLDDDLAALRALREQLRPGGRLLLTVPAHQMLWSDYDVASGHCRRYSHGQLESRLSNAGFRVEYCSSFMFVLLPLLLVRRRFRRGCAGTGQSPPPAQDLIARELRINPLLNRALELLLRPERWWIGQGQRLPCGASLLALAARI
jgi:SAM-dependent methyltransferase